MKRHHHKHKRTKNQHSNQSGATANPSPDDFNHVAHELVEAANRKIRDGVLSGDLRGHESDIRQEAVLLALSWYLRGENPTAPSGHAWHLPRAIAAAIRIAIRDHIKFIKRQKEIVQRSMQNEAPIYRHPTTLSARDWPYDVMQHLTSSAIKIALSERLISPLNAAIAMAVLVEDIEVADLARRRNMHPSNIYQHLTRARKHIVGIIDTIELPLTQL